MAQGKDKTMKLQKWNFKVRNYEPYEVPDGWKVKTYCADMEESVNCAECGREMTFGEGYTSRKVHSQYGTGYCVCGDCYEEEFREELREQRRQNND